MTATGCCTSTPPAPASRCGSGPPPGRGHAQLDAFGIWPGYRGTLVRDDYAAYVKYDQHLTAVQLCCAHLIRGLRGIGDMDEQGTRVQRCWTEPAISALTDAKAAVAKARADGVTALDGKLLAALRARYDAAVAWGIATNAHRDWPSGRHPGYTLARLQTRAARCGASRSTLPCRSPTTPPNSPSAW